MQYPAFYQNEDERQYQFAKEVLKAAINSFEHLRPDQQRRLLQELAQEKATEEFWRRAQSFNFKL